MDAKVEEKVGVKVGTKVGAEWSATKLDAIVSPKKDITMYANREEKVDITVGAKL